MALSEIRRLKQGLCISRKTEDLWKVLKKGSTGKGSLTSIYGCPDVGDYVLFTYSNRMNPLPGKFQSERVIYPPNGSTSRSATITGIAVIDLTTGGKGGETKFVRGVIPGDYAEIEISSHYSAGYSVKVIITGRI